MDEVKITDLIGEKASNKGGFDINGLLNTVKTLAELKKTTASFQQQQQPQQQQQQVIPVQAKIDKNVSAVTQRYEQELSNLRQQLLKQQQQKQKKEVSNNDNDILKILRGVNMDSEKISIILDFIIEEKGDLKISELNKLIDKTLNLVNVLNVKFDTSGVKQVKTAIKLINIMKGDINLSEVKELLKELKPLIN